MSKKKRTCTRWETRSDKTLRPSKRHMYIACERTTEPYSNRVLTKQTPEKPYFIFLISTDVGETKEARVRVIYTVNPRSSDFAYNKKKYFWLNFLGIHKLHIMFITTVHFNSNVIRFFERKR